MISIKSLEEIKIMTEGGEILAKIMKELKKEIKPGIATKELSKIAETLILKYGVKPSFKGYEGYPAVLCASVNEENVHVVPSDKVLKEGDIISLDLGIFYQGFHTDMAVTVPVGKISSQAQKLIQVTKKSLQIGIKEVRAGNTFGDIGNAVQKYVESRGFNVVRNFSGHGIGREIHEEPRIFNYVPSRMQKGKEKFGPEIKEGMVFCIEPMVTAGDWTLVKIKDGFGYQTADGSLSCHFEQTIALTSQGAKILTNFY